jgi:putative ABC transport system substrate-binding protein
MWFRTVSVIVTLGFLAALRAADAQPRRTIPVIGVLANADLSAALANPKSPVSALRQGLREMGYVEGQTIVLEYRPHGEKPAPLSTYAAELVRLQVDVLVTFGAAIPGQKSASDVLDYWHCETKPLSPRVKARVVGGCVPCG